MNLHVTVGLPGSGKSTSAKEFAFNSGAIHLSSDDLRLELFGDEDMQDKNDELFAELYKRAEEGLKSGKDVIIDSTNLSTKYRKHLIQTFRKYATKMIAHYFDTPLHICLSRNANRARQVPRSVIENMYKATQIPTQEEGWDEIVIHHHEEYQYPIHDLHELEKLISNECDYKVLMGGELYQYMPFRQIYGLAQDNPHHSLSVSRHTYYAWEYILKNYNDAGRLEMLWAVLLHDTGKFFTKSFKKLEDGTVSRYANFIGHENVSAQLACAFLKNLGYDDNFVLNVVLLVQNHMKLLSIGDSEKGKKKLREFVGDDVYQMLEFFREADTSAK